MKRHHRSSIRRTTPFPPDRVRTSWSDLTCPHSFISYERRHYSPPYLTGTQTKRDALQHERTNVVLNCVLNETRRYGFIEVRKCCVSGQVTSAASFCMRAELASCALGVLRVFSGDIWIQQQAEFMRDKHMVGWRKKRPVGVGFLTFSPL